jgi:hypothetical protein
MLLRDLVPKYCQGLESSSVYTAPPIFVECVDGRSNRNLPRQPLNMHADDIIPSSLTSKINTRISLSKGLNQTRLWSYKMFEVLVLVRIDNSVALWGIHNFHLLRHVFPYRLARGIPLKEGFWYPLQSKVITAPPHLL